MNAQHRDRHRERTAAPVPTPLKRLVERVDWTALVIFGVVLILIVQAVVREVIV